MQRRQDEDMPQMSHTITVRCEDEETKEVHQSYGRKKGSSDLPDTKTLELQSGDVVTDITMETPLFMVSSGKHPQSSEMTTQRKFTTTAGKKLS
ncbi:ZP domain-containing protein [Caerostris extrusa]|uniref:ZP domain-containing protein n=1 Tax=Caerostris extrusa TaxID=172846 RepID=A0AAV4SA60_CAEEX|nr:ZP domain-containing protein [Caerostris extrusa]